MMNPFKNKELIRGDGCDDQALKCDDAYNSPSQSKLPSEEGCDDSDDCDDKMHTLSKDKERAWEVSL